MGDTEVTVDLVDLASTNVAHDALVAAIRLALTPVMIAARQANKMRDDLDFNCAVAAALVREAEIIGEDDTWQFEALRAVAENDLEKLASIIESEEEARATD